MTLLRFIGVLLVVAGALALAEGGFNYTRDSKQMKLGPVELKLSEKERVTIPRWVGYSAVGLGLVLVLWGGRRR
ncbi:MAG: hypothetical protein ACK4F7_10610 [Inhella sp.]